MMGSGERVNREYLGSGGGEDEKLPTLYPSVVPGEPDTLQLTIFVAHLFRKGTLARLRFREYMGHILWVPKAELLNVADQLREDDATRWAGRMLTLVKVIRNKPVHRGGGTVTKYIVPPPAWLEMEGGDEPAAEPQQPARRMRERRFDH